MSVPNQHASYWLGHEFVEYAQRRGKLSELTEDDIYYLSALKRAISNFVSIATGLSIPVVFKSNDAAYTDGKRIVIGATFLDGKVDPVVGTALHESAHIIKTDFTVIQRLSAQGTRSQGKNNIVSEELFDRASEAGFTRSMAAKYLHKLWNWVEDRWIDDFMYRTCIGYRGYYDAMYNAYWHSDRITEGLRSSYARDAVPYSYLYRIINLTNSARDLDALPYLRTIWEITDVERIARMTHSQDCLDLAVRIFDYVILGITCVEEEPESEASDDTGEDGETTDESAEANEGEAPESSDDEHSGTSTDDSESDPGESDESSDSTGESEHDDTSESESDADSASRPSDADSEEGVGTPDLSKEEQDALEQDFENQQKFLAGTHADDESSPLSEESNNMLKTLEASDVSMQDVAASLSKKKVRCLVIRELNDAVAKSGMFIGILSPKLAGSDFDIMTIAIREGIVLGKRLARKLKVTSETNTTTTHRHGTGKIDRRIVHEFGAGNRRLFKQSETEQFSDAIIHISVDASGSMVDGEGDKWRNACTCAISIAKAADSYPNMDVIISFRGGVIRRTVDPKFSDRIVPAVLIAYDSRRDKFSKIPRLFPHIVSHGATPEGLAFEATMETFLPSTRDRDSYFLNFSDGEPWFQCAGVSYNGDIAYKHTADQVKTIKKRGIHVMSYFIENGPNTNAKRRSASRAVFELMYGKDAVFIDVNNVKSVSKTINNLFLNRKKRNGR